MVYFGEYWMKWTEKFKSESGIGLTQTKYLNEEDPAFRAIYEYSFFQIQNPIIWDFRVLNRDY